MTELSASDDWSDGWPTGGWMKNSTSGAKLLRVERIWNTLFSPYLGVMFFFLSDAKCSYSFIARRTVDTVMPFGTWCAWMPSWRASWMFQDKSSKKIISWNGIPVFSDNLNRECNNGREFKEEWWTVSWIEISQVIVFLQHQWYR